MSRRPYRRRHPVLTVAAVLVLAVFVVLPLLAHLLGFLVLLAVTAFGGYRLGLHARPVARARLTANAYPKKSMVIRAAGDHRNWRAQFSGHSRDHSDSEELRQQLAALTAERDQLAADLDQARAELSNAKASAVAAWDAAASAASRPAGTAQPDDPGRERLIDTPMSGVHPLGRQP